MENYKRRITGATIVTLVIISAISVVGKTQDAVRVEKTQGVSDQLYEVNRDSGENSSAIAVDDNQIFVLRGNHLFVIDRGTLTVKNQVTLPQGNPNPTRNLKPVKTE
jgi:hypothetical protein